MEARAGKNSSVLLGRCSDLRGDPNHNIDAKSASPATKDKANCPAVLGFAIGDAIAVWSNSKGSWLAGNVVDIATSDAPRDDVEVGSVKVLYQGFIKWIRPSDFASNLKREYVSLDHGMDSSGEHGSAANTQSPLAVTGESQCPLVNGRKDWIRQANRPEDRSRRRVVAEQTLQVCEQGYYMLNDKRVRLSRLEELVRGTRIKRAPAPARVCDAAIGLDVPIKCFRHSPGKLLEVAVDCTLAGHKVAVANASSAYHTGGGFREGGRHALEEALCTRTTLYQSLLAAREQSKLQNRDPPDGRTCCSQDLYIPADSVILSPHVEVFRGSTDEGYPFWPRPVELCAVVSVAMPNCNAKVHDAPVDAPPKRSDYVALLVTKFSVLCAAAAQSGARVLVLPDAGCGVYGNEPEDVGRALGDALGRCHRDSFDEVHLVGSSSFAIAVEAALRSVATPLRKGEKVSVWSNSKQMWLEGEVLEVIADSTLDGTGAIAGTAKIASSAGMKWIAPADMATNVRRIS